MGCMSSRPEPNLNITLNDLNKKPSQEEQHRDASPQLTVNFDTAKQIRSNSEEAEVERLADVEFNKTPINVCPGCRQTFKEEHEFLNAVGKSWHPECFTCSNCMQVLTAASQHLLKGGKILDHDCYFKLYGNKCSTCNEGVPEDQEFAKANGKIYHINCLTCSVCNRVILTQDNEKALLRDKNLFCEDCFLEKYGEKCVVCKKKIKGESVAAFNRYFCKNCFRCCGCKVLMDEYYNSFKGAGYCDPCYKRVKSAYLESNRKPDLGIENTSSLVNMSSISSDVASFAEQQQQESQRQIAEIAHMPSLTSS